MMYAVLACVEAQALTSPGALKTRQDLQLTLFSLATRFEIELGGLPASREQATRLWPVSIALQRLGYRVLAHCWALEEAQHDHLPPTHFIAALDHISQTLSLETWLARLHHRLGGVSAGASRGRACPARS